MAKGYTENENILAQGSADSLIMNDVASIDFGTGEADKIDLSSNFEEIKNAFEGEEDASLATQFDELFADITMKTEALSPVKAKLNSVNQLIAKAKYKEALTIINEILTSVDPGNTEAIYLSAVCYQRLKSYANAYMQLNKLEKMDITSGMRDSMRKVRHSLRRSIVMGELIMQTTMQSIDKQVLKMLPSMTGSVMKYLDLDPQYDMFYYMFALTNIRSGKISEAEKIVTLGKSRLGANNALLKKVDTIINRSKKIEKFIEVKKYYYKGQYLCAYRVIYDAEFDTPADKKLADKWMYFLSQVVNESFAKRIKKMERLEKADQNRMLDHKQKLTKARPKGTPKEQDAFYTMLLTNREYAAIKACMKTSKFAGQIPLMKNILKTYPAYYSIHFFLGRAYFEQYKSAPKKTAKQMKDTRVYLENARSSLKMSNKLIDVKILKVYYTLINNNLRGLDALEVRDDYEAAIRRFSSSSKSSASITSLMNSLYSLQRKARTAKNMGSLSAVDLGVKAPDVMVKEYNAITKLLDSVYDRCQKDINALSANRTFAAIQDKYTNASKAMELFVNSVNKGQIKDRDTFRKMLDSMKKVLNDAIRDIESEHRQLYNADPMVEKNINTMLSNLRSMLNSLYR